MNHGRKLRQLDIVIPCHNEQEVISQTHAKLTFILKDLVARQLIDSYSLIFVDNGSTDTTLTRLLNLFHTDKRTTIISLRNNFGYQGSITAGLYQTSGDAVVTIDADLQDPPEKFEEMIMKYQEGYDLVLGVRKNRDNDSYLKRVSTTLYYRLLRYLGVLVVPHHGDFRLMSRELADIFNKLPERNRFIRALILQLDSQYATVTYARTPRQAGYSKFNLGALLSLGLDGITSFSYVPLRIAALLGFTFSLLSFSGMGWVFYEKVTYDRVPGWASTVLPILFLSGIQLLFLGIIGEYLGKIYTEIKQRPLFTIRKKYIHSENNENDLSRSTLAAGLSDRYSV